MRSKISIIYQYIYLIPLKLSSNRNMRATQRLVFEDEPLVHQECFTNFLLDVLLPSLLEVFMFLRQLPDLRPFFILIRYQVNVMMLVMHR